MTNPLWPTCGYSLLTPNEAGHLVVTDDFLRFLLERPELTPIASSCAAADVVALLACACVGALAYVCGCVLARVRLRLLLCGLSDLA